MFMSKRITLEKDKQKELIELVKAKLNLSWNKLAKKLKVGESYLVNDLRKERRTLSENIYKRLCELGNINFDKNIIRYLNSNWGQIKGGKSVKIRKNLFVKKETKILCKKSVELAEIIGIILGDGSIFTIPEKSIYQVHVAGNLNDEKEYLMEHVKPLFEKIFKIKMNTKIAKNGIYVWKQSKDLVYTLNFYGLSSGNKKTNNAKIPDWIMDNKTYLKACIRGIFDTDGCVYPKNKTNLYPNIWISSAIPSLRESITNGLKKLDLNLSQWRDSRNDASLRRRDEVFKFFNVISFNNSKHIKRWYKFNRLPSSSPVS